MVDNTSSLEPSWLSYPTLPHMLKVESEELGSGSQQRQRANQRKETEDISRFGTDSYTQDAGNHASTVRYPRKASTLLPRLCENFQGCGTTRFVQSTRRVFPVPAYPRTPPAAAMIPNRTKHPFYPHSSREQRQNPQDHGHFPLPSPARAPLNARRSNSFGAPVKNESKQCNPTFARLSCPIQLVATAAATTS